MQEQIIEQLKIAVDTLAELNEHRDNEPRSYRIPQQISIDDMQYALNKQIESKAKHTNWYKRLQELAQAHHDAICRLSQAIPDTFAGIEIHCGEYIVERYNGKYSAPSVIIKDATGKALNL